MNGVQTRLKCKPNVKQCKRLVFPARSALFNHNILNTKAISHFQDNHILIRFVFPPLYASFYSSFWGPCRFPAFGAVVSPFGNGSFKRWILRFLTWKLLFPCVETAVPLRRHCRFPACILLFPCVETSGFGSRSRSGTGCLLRQLRIKSSFVKQRYVILFIAFAG